MNANKTRLLAEVLSIDAWHEPFTFDGVSSNVYVEVSFQNGRLGGDNSQFPFTFNIALRRAQLNIKVESPLKIDKFSISRSIPNDRTELTRIIKLREQAGAKVGFGGKITPASIAAVIRGEAHKSTDKEDNLEIKVVQENPRIVAVPRPKTANEYEWELFPSFEEILDGQPWHPVSEPRFAVRGAKESDAVHPAISVSVSCRLEDIEISDLRPKDTSIAGVLKEMVINKINEAAATQHLKLILRDLQLEAGEFNDRYSRLFIADTLAVEA